MEIEKEFLELLARGASEIGLPLSEKQLGLFREFRREFLIWNSKINLVSIKTPLDLPIKHFVDSLLRVQFVEHRAGSLLDIGTGAGFPGLPIKIALESLSVHLIDSSRKKTSFLRDIKGKLGLEGIRITQGRIEQLIADADLLGSYDIVISRAAFKMAELITIGTPFLAPEGTLIAMKSRDVKTEWAPALSAAEKAGLKLSACHERRLPLLGDIRKIVIFSKS
jgi:16S rRNA (guanine527-N7)-methyltransferase